jgi:hypothetical protein
VSEVLNEITDKLTELVNSEGEKSAVDFGAHIETVAPISSAATNASLLPVTSNFFMNCGNAEKSSKTLVVKPIELALNVTKIGTILVIDVSSGWSAGRL